MRLFTCLIVYAIVSIINAVHSGQPCAAVWKPDIQKCSHCPAKNCPSAKKAQAKKSCDHQPVFPNEPASKPIVQTDYALFPWNNKVRMLLN